MHVLAEAERSGSTCLPLDGAAGRRRASCSATSVEPIGARSTALVDARRSVVARGASGSTAPPPPSSRPSWPSGSTSSSRRAPSERLTRRPTDDADGGRRDELTAEQRAGAARRLRPPAVGHHRRPGDRQDGVDQDDRRAGRAAQGARVMLVAPTGRAAVRMSEASGLRARTVHSALGWIPGEGPTHDEQDPLPCDLLIVDETSMANLELLVTLLRAVGDAHPRGARRRRRSARAGRRRQAVRRARRLGAGADHAPDPHLPPGGRQHDRPGRSRDPARRAAPVRRPATACAATCS